jgi:hypothetical protein
MNYAEVALKLLSIYQVIYLCERKLRQLPLPGSTFITTANDDHE